MVRLKASGLSHSSSDVETPAFAVRERVARARQPVPAFGLVALLLVVACGTGSGPETPVRELVLGPDNAIVFVGETLQLDAQPRDASGNALSNRQITYQSSDLLVAAVSGSGLVSGLARGHVTISASCEGRSAEVGVDVRGGGVIGASGGSVTLTGGTARLSVPAGALSGDTRVYLDPAGPLPTAPWPLIQGTAFELGPAGLVLHQTAVLTIHYDPNVVDPALAASLGTYMVTGGNWLAVSGSTLDVAERTVTAPVTGPGAYGILSPGPVATMTIDPPAAQVVVGTSVPLTATLRDASGTVLTNRPIAWRSADPIVAPITQLGVVTGLGLGVTTVFAASGGATATATIIVSYICSCSPAPEGRASANACSCTGTPSGSRTRGAARGAHQ